MNVSNWKNHYWAQVEHFYMLNNSTIELPQKKLQWKWFFQEFHGSIIEKVIEIQTIASSHSNSFIDFICSMKCVQFSSIRLFMGLDPQSVILYFSFQNMHTQSLAVKALTIHSLGLFKACILLLPAHVLIDKFVYAYTPICFYFTEPETSLEK